MVNEVVLVEAEADSVTGTGTTVTVLAWTTAVVDSMRELETRVLTTSVVAEVWTDELNTVETSLELLVEATSVTLEVMASTGEVEVLWVTAELETLTAGTLGTPDGTMCPEAVPTTWVDEAELKEYEKVDP